jgi:hypothetical protein
MKERKKAFAKLASTLSFYYIKYSIFFFFSFSSSRRPNVRTFLFLFFHSSPWLLSISLAVQNPFSYFARLML